MAPKKSTRTALKKSGTMTKTAVEGMEFLKQSWSADKIKKVNELLDARDQSESSTDEETTTTKVSTKPKAKLSKSRTMKTTAKEAKVLLGKELIGSSRSDTRQRQAAVKAKKTLAEVTKTTAGRKTNLKRAGTMAKTAQEGKAFVQRTAASKKTTGRKRTGGRGKKSSK